MEAVAPIRLRQVSSLGLERVKGSYPAAVSLCFLTVIVRAVFWIAGRLAELLLPQIGSGAGTAVGLLLTVTLLSPLLLGVKGWHQDLDGEYHSPRGAFRSFSSWGAYLSALWYCIVRDMACLLAVLVPAMPALFLSAVVRLSLRQGGAQAVFGPFYGIFVLLVLALAVLGFIFSAYLLMGCFLADYLYVLGEEQNPFRALRESQRLMRGERMRLVRLMILLLPLGMLCVLLAPIPFVVPLIRSALSVYAQAEITRQRNGS